MTVHVICRTERSELPPRTPERLPVHLYTPRSDGTAGAIGNGVRAALERLDETPASRSLDLVNLALAVTAADTFVRRDVYQGDGWARELALEVPVSDPTPWNAEVTPLERVLRFLTGDSWRLEFRMSPPLIVPKRGLRRRLRPGNADCVSLFSGGLDSTIGVLDLLAGGQRPVLVSHAYPGDVAIQGELRRSLPYQVPHFSANADPTMDGTNETSMRSRSLLFLALGTVVAALLSAKRGMPTTLFVPENAFIAINPPLTKRRIGTLSTRTTHPHFLGLLQGVLTRLGVPVQFVNPYEFTTKGEMVGRCANPLLLARLAATTVSCGKWKRTRQQCGRCVPCVIRRAAFFAGGIADSTGYGSTVAAAMQNEGLRDDVLGLAIASRTMNDEVGLRRAVLATGPLDANTARRASLVAAVRRGLAEIAAYLENEGIR